MGRVEEIDPLAEETIPHTSGKSSELKKKSRKKSSEETITATSDKCPDLQKKPRVEFTDLLKQVTYANPAALRELFGSWWDLLYGALVIYTLFIGCEGIDSIPYPLREFSILIALFADLFVVIDTSVSVFIRLAQIARNISGHGPSFLSAVMSVLFNLVGLFADSIACLPYLILVQRLRGIELSLRYRSIAVIRLTRLFAPSRIVLPKNLKEATFRRLREKDQYLKKQCEINQEEAFKQFSADWDEMERHERVTRRNKAK